MAVYRRRVETRDGVERIQLPSHQFPDTVGRVGRSHRANDRVVAKTTSKAMGRMLWHPSDIGTWWSEFEIRCVTRSQA